MGHVYLNRDSLDSDDVQLVKCPRCKKKHFQFTGLEDLPCDECLELQRANGGEPA